MTTVLSATAIINEIKDLHELAIGYAKQSIDKAIRIGELLTEQKSKLEHGQWIPWVEENLPFNRTQAWKYMNVFENKELPDVHSSEHLTEAVQMLVTPKDVAGKEPDCEANLEKEQFEECMEEEIIEVEATQRPPRRKVDYGKLMSTVRQICSNAMTLKSRMIELQIQLKLIRREGRESVGAAWNKDDMDTLLTEIDVINKMLGKD